MPRSITPSELISIGIDPLASWDRSIFWACARYAQIAELCPRVDIVTVTVLCRSKGQQLRNVPHTLLVSESQSLKSNICHHGWGTGTRPFWSTQSSAMRMACWPVGIYCWDNFWLPWSIVRGPNMPKRMVCPANAASVKGRIVRFPRLNCGVGVYKLAISLSIRTGDYCGVELIRQELLS